MAKIIRKSSKLERDYKAEKNRAFRVLKNGALWLVGVLLGLVSSLFGSSFVGFLGVAVVGFFVLLVSTVVIFVHIAVAAYYFNKAEILRRGFKGETATAEIIATLPDSFVGFQNLVLTNGGKKSEIDLVVVGPTGVFVIETKNRKGKIVGNFDEREWVQYKIGRGGTPYNNEFYSPVKQVSTHIYRLVGFLKENGLRTHVSGAVYFPSFETSLSLKGTPGDLPVFCASNGGKTALKNYILQKDATLSPEYVAKLCALLKNT